MCPLWKRAKLEKAWLGLSVFQGCVLRKSSSEPEELVWQPRFYERLCTIWGNLLILRWKVNKGRAWWYILPWFSHVCPFGVCPELLISQSWAFTICDSWVLYVALSLKAKKGVSLNRTMHHFISSDYKQEGLFLFHSPFFFVLQKFSADERKRQKHLPGCMATSNI